MSRIRICKNDRYLEAGPRISKDLVNRDLECMALLTLEPTACKDTVYIVCIGSCKCRRVNCGSCRAPNPGNVVSSSLARNLNALLIRREGKSKVKMHVSISDIELGCVLLRLTSPIPHRMQIVLTPSVL